MARGVARLLFTSLVLRLVLQPSFLTPSVRPCGGNARVGAGTRSLRCSCSEQGQESELPDAAKVAAEWSVLQAIADAAEDGSSSQHLDRAAALMASFALDRLRPFVTPAGSIEVEPSEGGDDAVNALLPQDARFVAEFILDGQGQEGPSSVSQAFWQSEMYLRRLQQQITGSDIDGDLSLQESAAETKEAISKAQENLEMLEERSVDFQGVENSVLFARQQFIAAVRFGYFIRRVRHRLALEKAIRGSTLDLDEYIAAAPHRDLVEMVRIASLEATLAAEHRSNNLFGDHAAMFAGPGGLAQLRLSPEGCLRISLEAVAFGAALFEAEDEATQRYQLHYTSFGSRAESPLGL